MPFSQGMLVNNETSLYSILPSYFPFLVACLENSSQLLNIVLLDSLYIIDSIELS